MFDNPFEDQKTAQTYERWYHTTGKQAATQEKSLLQWLLSRFGDVKTILDVGCGTGYFTQWYHDLGMSSFGLDRSLQMILQARKRHDVACCQGDAHMLPFQTNAFDVVSLVTVLEFVENPAKVLSEGLRVSRKGLVMGAINRHSLLGWQYRKKGGLIWRDATLFTPAELSRLITENASQALKNISRTTLIPFTSGWSKLPWGSFIGMAIVLPFSEENNGKQIASKWFPNTE